MELRSGSQGLKSSAARNLEPDSGGMRQRDSEMRGDLISPDHWTINFNWHIDFPLCVTPQGLSYVSRVYLYLYSAICVSRLTYVYHRTALPLIPDISTISILSCFRFTDASWLTCLFGPHFSRSCCPFNSYLPPLFLARVSHFYSYNSDLFCSLLSTILRISQPIPGFLTRLLGSL